jgi:hypothetical protein
MLFFDLDDIHGPILKMEEDMEFERGLSVKRILEICLELLVTFS